MNSKCNYNKTKYKKPWACFKRYIVGQPSKEYIEKNNVWTGAANCVCDHERIFWCLFRDLRNTLKITLEWALKQFTMTVYISFHFFHDILNPHIKITRLPSHADSVPPSVCSADDVSFDCWWRHKCTLKSQSNSFEISFIYGHIHDRSSKKAKHTALTFVLWHPTLAPANELWGFHFVYFDTKYRMLTETFFEIGYFTCQLGRMLLPRPFIMY